MITEIAPITISGSLGATVQNMVTFGFVIAYSLGFLVPYEYMEDGQLNDEIYTSEIWRYIFSIPGVIALIQFLFLMTIFRDETPKFYEKNGQQEEARQVYLRIHSEDALETPLLSNNTNVESFPREEATFFDIFGSKYRFTLFVGLMVFTLSQFTGINAVLFYSNEIFTLNYVGHAAEREARIGTMLIGITMFVTSFLSSILLARMGRRKILLIGHLGMFVALAVLGVLTIYENNLWIKVLTISFVFFYGFSIGTLVWIYTSEILTENGMSFATFWNWLLTILFGLFTSQGFEALTPQGMYFLF